MVGSLVFAAVAFRAGLRLRQNRRDRKPGRADLWRLHLRVAKPAVLTVLIGFVAGPISAIWLRDWGPFSTLHAWLGLAAATLFVAAAFEGRRRELGRGGSRDRHALLAALALLFGAAAAMAGMVLLP